MTQALKTFFMVSILSIVQMLAIASDDKIVTDAKPLDRAFKCVGLGPHHAAHGGCHLGAQRNLTFALVGEVKELPFDLVTRLGLVEI